ncbi:N-acetylmuramoyl-L-alanine amidase [Pseudonocardia sp. GCM10023141]|uniref:peptidoglycan recognition protein family protein n=1 Tax=Pseudonocardia sp. GCM10023141 TaxID=3252653 RepID=UPI00361C343B
MSRRGILLGGLALAGGGVFSGALSGGTAWAADSPLITDCNGWGARPNSDIVEIWNQRPVKIIVHHTASANVENYSQDAAFGLARSIQNFHMDGRGWLDTGQHFTISRGGFVMEGRHRSLEVLRIGQRAVEGAHCVGQNIVAVGIENEGLYTDVDPPQALWDRLRQMCAYICQQYGIAPTELYGHRDFNNTACPGDRLYGQLPRLRTEVAGALGIGLEGGAARKASWPLLRRGDRGVVVQAAQYLLRDARATEAAPTGVFDVETDAAVRRFQVAHGAAKVNGLLGGQSWPVLARTVARGEGSDAERAAATLAAARGAEGVPNVVTAPDWQRLLGTGGAPMNTTADPLGPPR